MTPRMLQIDGGLVERPGAKEQRVITVMEDVEEWTHNLNIYSSGTYGVSKLSE